MRVFQFPYSLIVGSRVATVDTICVPLSEDESVRLIASAKDGRHSVLSDDPEIGDILRTVLSTIEQKEQILTDFLYEDPDDRERHYDLIRRVPIRVLYPRGLRRKRTA